MPVVLGKDAMSITPLLCAAALTGTPSYHLASSENFSVYSPSPATSRSVLKTAEAARNELAKAWLGRALETGAGRTIINVKLAAGDDGGRSAVMKSLDDPHGNIIWIRTADPGTANFRSVLKHELTHCVLATAYPGQLKVWAHEGCAGCCDVGLRRRLQTQTIAEFGRLRPWPSLKKLLAAKTLSPDDHDGYSAAISVTQFLIDRADRETLLRFAVDTAGGESFSQSLADHYNIASIAELQSRWQRWELANRRRLAVR